MLWKREPLFVPDYEVTRGGLTGFTFVGSMVIGLGATPEEWEKLKGEVDDSFWCMRIIGSLILLRLRG